MGAAKVVITASKARLLARVRVLAIVLTTTSQRGCIDKRTYFLVLTLIYVIFDQKICHFSDCILILLKKLVGSKHELHNFIDIRNPT